MYRRLLAIIPSVLGALAIAWVVEAGALLVGQPLKVKLGWYMVWLGPYVATSTLALPLRKWQTASLIFAVVPPVLVSAPLGGCITFPGACEYLIVLLPVYTWAIVLMVALLSVFIPSRGVQNQ